MVWVNTFNHTSASTYDSLLPILIEKLLKRSNLLIKRRKMKIWNKTVQIRCVGMQYAYLSIHLWLSWNMRSHFEEVFTDIFLINLFYRSSFIRRNREQFKMKKIELNAYSIIGGFGVLLMLICICEGGIGKVLLEHFDCYHNVEKCIYLQLERIHL